MRHELSPFEGDLVSVTGWIKEWRKNRSDETDDICIVNASLTRWDGSSAVDIYGCEAKVHHIWIRIPKNLCDPWAGAPVQETKCGSCTPTARRRGTYASMGMVVRGGMHTLWMK